MSRILLILSLLLAAVSQVCAADSQDQFMTAYESCQEAQALERAGNVADALNKYRYAESLLVQIAKSDPSWNKLVVEYRLSKVREGLSRLEGKAPDQGVSPDSGGGSNTENNTPAASPSPAQQDGSASPSIEIVPPSARMGVSGSDSAPQGEKGTEGTAEASSLETRRLQKIIQDLRKQLQEANDVQHEQEQRASDLENADWVQQRSELLNQLDVAKRRISDLESDLHGRDSWGKELKDLQKKLDDAVADKLVEEEQFEGSYKKVADANSVLMKQLQETRGEVTVASDSTRKIDELTKEVQQGKDAVAQLQDKMSHAESASKELLARNDDLQKQMDQATGQLSSAQKQARQVAPLLDKIKDLQSRVDEGSSAIRRDAALQADVQVLEEDRDRLEQKVNQFAEAAQEASKVKGLTSEAETLKKTVADLQERLDREHAELQKAHADAESATLAERKAGELQRKSVADAEADRDVLEEEQNRLFSKLTQASLWLDALQKQGESLLPLKNEVGQLKGQLEENDRTLKQSTAKLAEAELDSSALRNEVQQKDKISRSETDLLMEQNASLQNQLKTALEHLASEVDQSSGSSALQDQIKKLREQVDLNARNFAQSQQKLVDLDKAQPDQTKALMEKEKELVDAQGQAAGLQSQLAEAGRQIAALQKQGGEGHLKELQDDLAERDATIARLKSGNGTADGEQMLEENTLLRGIVLREIKNEAKRAQAHRLMEDELARLHVQSETLQQQMTTLAAPVLDMTDQERTLFKDGELVVSDSGGDNLDASISIPLNGGARSSANGPQRASGATDSPTASHEAGDTNTPSGELSWQGRFKGLLKQAKDEFDRQDYLEAENTFQEALKLSPNDYFALSNLGVVEFQLGKMDEAEASLENASRQSSSNSFALTTLGIVHYRQKRLQDAETVLRKSIGINDRDFTAHNYLGIVLAASGDGKDGESEIMKALEINPDYADAHFNLAVIYATGKPPSKMMARKHYNKALELGSPPDPSLEHLLE